MRRLCWLGFAGGLLAGSAVGLAEAVWVLSQAPTGEYTAMLHGALLYGILGACSGIGVGLLLGLLAALGWRARDPQAYTLGMLISAAGLGSVVIVQVLDRALYLDLGLPMHARLGLALLGLGAAVLLVWLGPVFLTRTPLKILLFPRGTLTAWLAVLGLAALFAFTPTDTDGPRSVAPELPRPEDDELLHDVVLVTVESLRADAWVAGAPPSLAGEALVFDQHVVQSSWLRPSLASILTSQLPAAHGCEVLSARLEGDRVTLAELMRDRGYMTVALPARAELERAYGFDQGFLWRIGMEEDRGPFRAESARRLLLTRGLRTLLRRMRGTEPLAGDLHRPASDLVAAAKRAITANRAVGNRSFVWVHLAEPSLPWFGAPGEQALELPDGSSEAGRAQAAARYGQEIGRVDAAIAGLVSGLKQAGVWEDALLVVVGVFGEERFEHGGSGHGQTLFDEVIRTPLVMKLPRQRAAGVHVDAQVRSIDIAPTIAAGAGCELPAPWEGERLDGEDLRRWLAGEGPALADRPAVSQLHLGGAVMEALREPDWKLIRAGPRHPRGLGSTEVYDLELDPMEQSNLVGQAGPRQADLSRRLREMLAVSASWRVQPPIPGP